MDRKGFFQPPPLSRCSVLDETLNLSLLRGAETTGKFSGEATTGKLEIWQVRIHPKREVSVALP